jgi:hypothetical protein
LFACITREIAPIICARIILCSEYDIATIIARRQGAKRVILWVLMDNELLYYIWSAFLAIDCLLHLHDDKVILILNKHHLD